MPMNNNGLTKLAEECGELVQVVSKKIAFYDCPIHPDGSDLLVRLHEEIADVLAAIEFVSRKFALSAEFIENRKQIKLERFEMWDSDPNS